jgi:hypothetical protein
MEVIIWIMFFVTIIACTGMLLGFVDGRRKYKLELHKEERRLVEARTKEIEAQNQRIELEYQQALGQIERFDRHAGVQAAKPPAASPQPPQR